MAITGYLCCSCASGRQAWRELMHQEARSPSASDVQRVTGIAVRVSGQAVPAAADIP